MSARSPGSRTVRVSAWPPASFTLQQTVPTGFSSVPPSGPAMPVIATAVSASKRLSAPPPSLRDWLGNRAVPLDQRGSTPSSSTFASFARDHSPPRTTRSPPLGELCGEQPRGQDSAVAMRRPARQLGDLVVHARPVLGEDLARVALVQQSQERLVDRGGRRLQARDHLDLAAPQAGRDLEPLETVDALLRVAQRVRQPGLGEPEHPHRGPGGIPSSPAASRTGSLATAVRHRGWSSRGGPGSTTTVGFPGTHHPRRCPDGSITSRLRDQSLLAVRPAHRIEVPVAEASHQRLQDRRDLVLELLIEGRAPGP